MIEIFYNEPDVILEEITNKLINQNVGYKLIQNRKLLGISIVESNKTYKGIKEVTDFVESFLKDIEGWGRCACEDKDY